MMYHRAHVDNICANSAKRTAGHLLLNDVICIVTHTSPLKTNADDSRFELSNLRLFLCMRSSTAEKFTVLGCYGHNLNTDRKQRLFLITLNAHTFSRKKFDSVCFQRRISKWRSVLWRRSALPYTFQLSGYACVRSRRSVCEHRPRQLINPGWQDCLEARRTRRICWSVCLFYLWLVL